MDVYSGAVHVVDDVMYDMLDYTLEPFMAEAKCPDYIKRRFKKISIVKKNWKKAMLKYVHL